MKWSELSMTEKNEVIKMAVAQGIKDIPSIKNLYEESVNGSRRFEDGGKLSKPKRSLENGRKLEYHPEGDYYYGGIPFKITVTSKRKKDKPYRWVSARTPQLTADDVSKAYTAATVGLLPNPIAAASNLSKGDWMQALKDLWLYNDAGDNGNNNAVVGFGVPEGSLFSSVKTAAKATPKQWTAAQDAAIARGDMAEAQRLRDLHFKVSAPETKQRTPMFNASGESAFNEFNGGETGLNWFSESEKYASNHGVPRAFYINEPDIYLGNVPAWIKGTPANKRYIESLKKLGYSEYKIAQKVQEINEAANSTAPAAKSVGMGLNNELVTRNNNTIKLADAITYDNNGVRIPLGKRDNFNINDIRYAIAPFLIGSAAYGLSNERAEGGSIHIAPSKKGTFTAAATKHGMGVQEFASKVLSHPEDYSLTMRKKANFAKNFGGRK